MDKTTISGINIFRDKKNRIIYRDPITKNAYQIFPQDEKGFYAYSNRYLLIALAMILSAGYFISWLQALGLGILLVIGVDVYARFKYLPKLKKTSLPDSAKRYSLLENLVNRNQPGRSLLKAFLYLAFSILIVVNGIIQKSALAILAVCLLLSIFSLYYALMNGLAFIKLQNRKRT